jgi:diguanylate cyclase (GGDEF)-like protein
MTIDMVEDEPIGLVLDDSEDFRELIRIDSKACGKEFTTAASFATVLRVIHAHEDKRFAVFVDWNLNPESKMTGLDMVRYLKATVPHRVVVSVLTGTDERDAEDRALAAGASAFFRKGVDHADRLIKYTRKAYVEQQLRYDDIDPLTGLYNYRGFERRVHEELRTLWRNFRELMDKPVDRGRRRKEEKSSLLCMDLDGFKSINDNHGHLKGDEAIIAAAHSIRDHCRPSDHPCRYHGDEFLVLIPGLDAQEADIVGSHLQKEVAMVDSVRDKGGRPIQMGISWGVADIPHSEIGFDPEVVLVKLIRSADEHLYEVKRTKKVQR